MLANCQFAFNLAFSTTIGTLYLHDRYFLHSSALTALRPIALGTGQKSDVPCLPQAFALFRHRRGRKTETSSDASRDSLFILSSPAIELCMEASYGISTVTLKNLWSELVGYCQSPPFSNVSLPAHRSSRSGRCPICIIVVGRVARPVR